MESIMLLHQLTCVNHPLRHSHSIAVLQCEVTHFPFGTLLRLWTDFAMMQLVSLYPALFNFRVLRIELLNLARDSFDRLRLTDLTVIRSCVPKLELSIALHVPVQAKSAWSHLLCCDLELREKRNLRKPGLRVGNRA